MPRHQEIRDAHHLLEHYLDYEHPRVKEFYKACRLIQNIYKADATTQQEEDANDLTFKFFFKRLATLAFVDFRSLNELINKEVGKDHHVESYRNLFSAFLLPFLDTRFYPLIARIYGTTNEGMRQEIHALLEGYGTTEEVAHFDAQVIERFGRNG